MSDNKDSKYDGVPIHEYDGIQELNNHLPRWWLATFYGAIAFSVVYIAYYHIGPGPNQAQELAAELQAIEMAKKADTKADDGPSEETIAAVVKDPAKLASGKAAFVAKCSSCHGPEGQGSIGPNLTDAYWIHGGKTAEIVKVVADGVLDKGMPPWKAAMTPDEFVSVVAYVKSIRGTKPANPKAPQGELESE